MHHSVAKGRQKRCLQFDSRASSAQDDALRPARPLRATPPAAEYAQHTPSILAAGLLVAHHDKQRR